MSYSSPNYITMMTLEKFKNINKLFKKMGNNIKI